MTHLTDHRDLERAGLILHDMTEPARHLFEKTATAVLQGHRVGIVGPTLGFTVEVYRELLDLLDALGYIVHATRSHGRARLTTTTGATVQVFANTPAAMRGYTLDLLVAIDVPMSGQLTAPVVAKGGTVLHMSTARTVWPADPTGPTTDTEGMFQ